MFYQATELFYRFIQYDDCGWYGKTIRIAYRFWVSLLSARLNYRMVGLEPRKFRRLPKVPKPEADMPSLRSDTGKGLAVLDLPRTVLLEADRLYGDEARCVLRRPVHV